MQRPACLRLAPFLMPSIAAAYRDYSGKYCLLASTTSELMLKCVMVMLMPPTLFALAHTMLRRRRCGVVSKSLLPTWRPEEILS